MNYAHKKGIEVIGDIPMYVSDDSADAWSEPRTSGCPIPARRLRFPARRPTTLRPRAGVGQPDVPLGPYEETGYRWWMDRLRRAFSLYDRVRLDHFLGFHSYFSIPAGKACADGRWLAGPAKTCSRPPTTSWARSTLLPRTGLPDARRSRHGFDLRLPRHGRAGV